ncbi:TetR-like C-terminal domain-containing protein [Streptomyces sp. SAS_267]|uniref:TetR-like C-terminal domain-containing protein n=1 Tax=Streptomyces sp. SAS_267 TaxID=3412750 RepID=UPI00403D38BF
MQLLERGVARGEVRPDVDLGDAATLVASSLFFRMIGEQRLPDAALVDSMVDMIGRAVATPP